MKLIKIIECLENWAPPILQEEYDNSGLIIGNPNNEIKGILVTLDCTEEILNEALNISNLVLENLSLKSFEDSTPTSDRIKKSSNLSRVSSSIFFLKNRSFKPEERFFELLYNPVLNLSKILIVKC